MTNSGLTAEQESNARAIIAVAKSMFPAAQQRQASIVALATALQESNLINVNYGDRDSLGLFQQRASWGTAAQRMNPTYAATQFFTRLQNVPGWSALPVTVAAQTVQVSAYPDAYAKHVPLATQATDALFGDTVTNASSASAPAGLGSIIGNLTNPGFWMRSGLFVLGGTLVLIAVLRMLSQTSAAQTVIDTTTKTVKGAMK